MFKGYIGLTFEIHILFYGASLGALLLVISLIHADGIFSGGISLWLRYLLLKAGWAREYFWVQFCGDCGLCSEMDIRLSDNMLIVKVFCFMSFQIIVLCLSPRPHLSVIRHFINIYLVTDANSKVISHRPLMFHGIVSLVRALALFSTKRSHAIHWYYCYGGVC